MRNANDFIADVLSNANAFVDYDEAHAVLSESDDEQFDLCVRFSYLASEQIAAESSVEKQQEMYRNARKYLQRISELVLNFNLCEANAEDAVVE